MACFTEDNLELAMSAQVNFENAARMIPGIAHVPMFVIAKEQLDELIKRMETEAE